MPAATAPARAPRAVRAWSMAMAGLYPGQTGVTARAWACKQDVSPNVHLERTRRRGVNPLVYWLVRGVIQPFFHLYFRMSRIGREFIPQEGGVILAANHRSFLDP